MPQDLSSRFSFTAMNPAPWGISRVQKAGEVAGDSEKMS